MNAQGIQSELFSRDETRPLAREDPIVWKTHHVADARNVRYNCPDETLIVWEVESGVRGQATWHSSEGGRWITRVEGETIRVRDPKHQKQKEVLTKVALAVRDLDHAREIQRLGMELERSALTRLNEEHTQPGVDELDRKPRKLRAPALDRVQEPRAVSPSELGFIEEEARAIPRHEAPFLWISVAAIRRIEAAPWKRCEKALAKHLLLAHAFVANSVLSACYICPRAHLAAHASIGERSVVTGNQKLAAIGLLRIRNRKRPGHKENDVNGYLLTTTTEAGNVEHVMHDPSCGSCTTGHASDAQTVERDRIQNTESPALEAHTTSAANSAPAGGGNRALSSGKESKDRFARPIEDLTKTPLGKRLAKFFGQSQMAVEAKQSGAGWIRIIREEPTTLADLLDQGERIKESELPTGLARAKFLTKRLHERRDA